jgi:hypothetical protein
MPFPIPVKSGFEHNYLILGNDLIPTIFGVAENQRVVF